MKKIIGILIIIAIAIGIRAYYKDIPPNEITSTTEEEVKVEASLNRAFDVKNHTITAWAVTEDSRCASDVQCIQAGRVRVALNVVSPSGSSITEMEPGKTYTTETIAITLDKVEPHPVSTHKITDSEYRFFFTVRDHQSGF
jgi:hypothetical protein